MNAFGNRGSCRRALLLTSVVFGWTASLLATEYTLSVGDCVTTDLASAMAAAYPGAALAENDTIVKTGLGTLTDSETALAKESPLAIEVREGVFYMNVSRQVSTWTVKSGAALRVGKDLNSLVRPNDTTTFTTFNVEGDGTADYPGAVYFDVVSSAWEQQQNFVLTGDATLAFASHVGGFNFSSRGTDDTRFSKYVMNGHDLTLKRCGGAGTASSFVRFRYAVSFIDPGRLILDGVWMTHLKNSQVYVKKAGGSVATKLPVELRNGARINVSDEKIGAAIDSLTCEYGTSIGKINNDGDAAATVKTIVGCPTITADQTITVGGKLVARASDVAAGHVLTSAGSLAWADGAVCVLVGSDVGVVPGSAYAVATSATAMTGVAGAGESALEPTRLCTVTMNDARTEVDVSYQDASVAADEYVIFAEKGKTANLSVVLSNLSESVKAAIAGKKLVKYGSGTVRVDLAMNDSGAKGVVVRCGVYEVPDGVNYSKNCPFPIDRPDAATTNVNVTVANGATLRLGASLMVLSYHGAFNLTAGGAGAAGEEGAVVFTVRSDDFIQHAAFELTDDAVFAFKKAAEFNFSNDDNSGTSERWNRFVMNRHTLTFKNATGVSGSASNFVRFRLNVTFVDPGPLVLDGVWLTRLPSGGVRTSATDGGATTLAIRMKNGASLNCANSNLADKLSKVEGDLGTSLSQFKDASSAITLPELTGPVAIAAGQAAVTVSERLGVRKADLVAGNALSAAGQLTLGANCRVVADSLEGVTLPTEGQLVASGNLVGAPLKAVSVLDSSLRANARCDGTSPSRNLRLFPIGGLLLMFR